MFKMSFSQLAKKKLRICLFSENVAHDCKVLLLLNCAHNFLLKHLLQCNYCNRGLRQNFDPSDYRKITDYIPRKLVV